MSAPIRDIRPRALGDEGRFAVLDVMRGLAALMVFVQHGLERGGLQTIGPGAFATTWLNLGEAGVGLFFLISGFIIPASMAATPTPGAFAVRRALRIYPLYGFVFAATYLSSSELVAHHDVPLGVLVPVHAAFLQEWLGLPSYVAGSWTLLIEAAWYAAFAAAYFSPLGAGVRLLTVFLAGYAAATVLTALFWPDAPLGRLSTFALCFLGYLYLLRFEGRIARGPFLRLWACFHVLILANMLIRFDVNQAHESGPLSLPCVVDSRCLVLVLFPLLLWLRDRPLARARPLRRLGEISYSVYLLHGLAMEAVALSPLRGIPFLLCSGALTLAVSALTYRWIEHPGVALARRLTGRRGPDQRDEPVGDVQRRPLRVSGGWRPRRPVVPAPSTGSDLRAEADPAVLRRRGGDAGRPAEGGATPAVGVRMPGTARAQGASVLRAGGSNAALLDKA